MGGVAEVDPAELEPGEVARLPTKPSEAVAALKEDKELRELMGEALVTAISAIRLVRSRKAGLAWLGVRRLLQRLLHRLRRMLLWCCLR